MHKRNQFFHELSAGLDNILKLVDHDHLLALFPAGNPDQNITKSRKRLHLIAVTAHLHAPLADLLRIYAVTYWTGTVFSSKKGSAS